MATGAMLTRSDTQSEHGGKLTWWVIGGSMIAANIPTHHFQETTPMRGTVLAWLLSCTVCVAQPVHLRPPAAPLVVHDPYFSIWSPADKLTDADTVHWTGKPQPLRCTVRVDGRSFRVMGAQPADAPALPQIDMTVWPTRTIYRFADQQVN